MGRDGINARDSNQLPRKIGSCLPLWPSLACRGGGGVGCSAGQLSEQATLVAGSTARARRMDVPCLIPSFFFALLHLSTKPARVAQERPGWMKERRNRSCTIHLIPLRPPGAVCCVSAYSWIAAGENRAPARQRRFKARCSGQAEAS